MHNLEVYNSLKRSKEQFKPIAEGKIGMYVCGPTVYSDVHIGNCRTFVSFDVIYRFLLYLGYKVRYVRNITDVGHLLDDGEDRISKGARKHNLEPMEVVQRYMNGFHKMMDIFNTKKPDIEPRATGHILEQIEMVQAIIDNGLAYEKNGSVYFNTKKYLEEGKAYGELSGRKIDDLLSMTRDDLKNQDEKDHPSDFAIWIKASPDHIMRWNAPWSVGFPGWHLECSVMSTKYLGETFDIHGGGNDLKFPHHENEIAQNVGACNCQPARYWLHTNMLLMNGRKMSKSEDNSITPQELFSGDSKHISQGYHPMALRFFMLQSHYRSTLDLTDDALKAADKGFKRLCDARKTLMSLESSSANGSKDQEIRGILDGAIAEMCDDFNTPKALAKIFELVPIINSYADGKIAADSISQELLASAKKEFEAIYTDVFGLYDPQEEGGGSHDALDKVMRLVLDIRQDARTNKDWDTSDKIRDGLAAAGITVKDGKDGSSWSV